MRFDSVGSMSALSALCDASSEAYELATRGDFAKAETLSDQLAREEAPAIRAWRLVLDAVRFSALGTGAPPWSPKAIGAFVDDTAAHVPAALVCGEAERHAFLAHDTEALAAWCAVHDQLDAGGLSARRARVWLDLARGSFELVEAEARALEPIAAREGRAAMVVDLAATRALALQALGKADDAKSVARRASRMARTEAFPQSEYLAHLVLARVRRHDGHPHLATRILEALSRVASPSWRAWLRVELALSGALEVERTVRSEDTPWGRFASALVAGVEATERGDRAAFDVVSPPLFADEVRELLAIVDPERSPDGFGAPFASGDTDDLPKSLVGLLARPGSAPADDSALAYVVARPNQRRRVPRIAYGLTSKLDLSVLPQSRRKQGRSEMLVALLALEPDGLTDERCFERIYGFEYEVELHKGVFDVLVHRTREYLGALGRIVRGDGRIALALEESILVADPRCTKPLPDNLLRIVAQQRGATAKEIAAAAGVSLRAAQSALRDLAETGACEAKRSGRTVHYVVEDTTFSEPTRHRISRAESTPDAAT